MTIPNYRGVHQESKFGIPVSPVEMPQEWEWTLCNLGIGIGTATREQEGKCGKIPAQYNIFHERVMI